MTRRAPASPACSSLESVMFVSCSCHIFVTHFLDTQVRSHIEHSKCNVFNVLLQATGITFHQTLVPVVHFPVGEVSIMYVNIPHNARWLRLTQRFEHILKLIIICGRRTSCAFYYLKHFFKKFFSRMSEVKS